MLNGVESEIVKFIVKFAKEYFNNFVGENYSYMYV